MTSQHRFYEILAQIDMGFGILFGSVFIGVVTLWNIWRYKPVRAHLEWALIAVWPPAWGALLVTRYFKLKAPKRFWSWMIPIAAVLRLPLMGNSFWYDETWSGAIARLPLSALPGVVMADVHPPLPYFIFWVTSRVLGSSDEFSLRMPSLVLGLGSIYLIYRFAMALGVGRQAAQLAAVITAILPAHLYYSTESRGYMLLTCLVLISAIAILENRPRLFVTAGMLPWVHAYGFIYLAALGFAALVYHPQQRWFSRILSAGLFGAAWLPFAIKQSVDVANGFWLQPLTIPGALWYIVDMTVSSRMKPEAVLFAFIPIMGVTIVSLSYSKWILSRKGFIWLVVAVGVPLIAAAISFLWRPIYLLRALLPAALMFVVPWAYLLVKVNRPRILRLSFAPALLIALASNYLPDMQRMDIRSAYGQCRGADYVHVLSSATGVMALYYAPSPVLLWTKANDLNQYLSSDGKTAFGFWQGDMSVISGWVCTPVQYNPLTSKSERYYISELLKYPHIAYHYARERFYQFTIYWVRLP